MSLGGDHRLTQFTVPDEELKSLRLRAESKYELLLDFVSAIREVDRNPCFATIQRLNLARSALYRFYPDNQGVIFEYGRFWRLIDAKELDRFDRSQLRGSWR